MACSPWLIPAVCGSCSGSIQCVQQVRAGITILPRRFPICSGRKSADIDWEEPSGEILLSNADLMELKFRRLIGEPPELRLAKVVAKKLNPHLYNLEIDKLVKKKGVQTYLRLIPEPARAAAYNDLEDETESGEAEAAVEDEAADAAIPMAPRPRPVHPVSDSQKVEEEEQDGEEDHQEKPEEFPKDESSSEFMSLATAARLDRMNRDEAPPRPARKFDRPPKSKLDMVERKIKWRK